MNRKTRYEGNWFVSTHTKNCELNIPVPVRQIPHVQKRWAGILQRVRAGGALTWCSCLYHGHPTSLPVLKRLLLSWRNAVCKKLIKPWTWLVLSGTNVTSGSTLFFFFFFLSVRFCLLTTLAPIRTTQEGCSSCCRHLQQGPTGATSERWLFVWFWFLQLLCMAWMLARSCWSMPACLHSTGHVEQALPQEPVAASLQRARRSLPEEQISCRQFQITVNLLAVYQKTNTWWGL